jgi:hypothetical protein
MADTVMDGTLLEETRHDRPVLTCHHILSLHRISDGLLAGEQAVQWFALPSKAWCAVHDNDKVLGSTSNLVQAKERYLPKDV